VKLSHGRSPAVPGRIVQVLQRQGRRQGHSCFPEFFEGFKRKATIWSGEPTRLCQRTFCHLLSWTTDRSIAEELAQYASREAGLSGRVVIFRVRISRIEEGRIYEGEAREDEYLIEGAVENVLFSEDADGEGDD